MRCSCFVSLLALMGLSLPFGARAAALADASDVSLELSFVGGVSTFRAGEPIRLQLMFEASSAGLWLNVTTTTPPSPVDTITLTPLDGVFDWAKDRTGGHGFAPDYATLAVLEPGKPLTITLTLNDIYRFDAAGKYRVSVTSQRLSGGMQDVTREFPALQSNELDFVVEPAADAAEAAEAKGLEREIRAATDRWAAQALADRLDYLGGDAATRAKLSLFLNPKTFYPFGVDVKEGLWIARNREMVVRRLEEALSDPGQKLEAGGDVFRTTVELASRLESTASSRREVEPRLCHLVATTLAQRSGESLVDAARTVFVTLGSNKQVDSEDFRSARESLITHFDEVDQYNVDWLLNAFGEYLDDLRLFPILHQMLQKPNVSRTAILQYLAVHEGAQADDVSGSVER